MPAANSVARVILSPSRLCPRGCASVEAAEFLLRGSVLQYLTQNTFDPKAVSADRLAPHTRNHATVASGTGGQPRSCCEERVAAASQTSGTLITARALLR